MERFLCHLPAHSSSSEGCFMSNKENILLRDEALQEERLEGFLCPSEEEQRESRFHADAGPSSSKRKISERSEDEDLTAPKRGCPSPFSPTVDLTGWESRQQQEEDDRRLALVLQKELDQEERQRASDRRKGSAEPYLLRQNRGSTKTSSTNTSSTKTSSRGSTRTSSCPETSSRGGPETSSRGSPETSSRGSPETSSRGSTETSSRGSTETSSRGSPETSSSADTPSSKTSSSRRSKQATLMEMFSLSS
ncbi:E3 ubiquitin-protein ligase rnf168-like [Gymnodraco acuticeps]|uniref:E3 ubiquitin-protein ligase rnf168-like n=1 Tax=Gymnodraco acuticeps TaxID=8218 RepID=A0A6P8VZ31_GYMAC|nr:E3 ubiquitin-protein ligase rnf168-like [Gymnodraco acuticeps]